MASVAQFKAFGPFFNSSGTLYILRVYHYSAGTTTLKDGYTTRAKAGTVAQPLESDSAGIASAYWDGLYKFRVDGSTDGVNYSTIYTWDNVALVDQVNSAPGEGDVLTAASTLTLGTDGNFFHVSGATTIAAISGNQSRITLIFDSTPTLTNSGSLVLAGDEDYTAAASDILEFVNEGSGVWRECGRSRGLLTPTARQATLTASTSGTSISFTGIPAGVKRITVMLVGVSTNGTDPYLIQLGDAGGIEDTNYLGASNMVTNAAATAGANSTAGLLIQSASAANVFHGTAVFNLVDKATFSWVGHGVFAISNAASNVVSACKKSLSAELTQLKITTTGGTNTFDAGSINISYE